MYYKTLNTATRTPNQLDRNKRSLLETADEAGIPFAERENVERASMMSYGVIAQALEVARVVNAGGGMLFGRKLKLGVTEDTTSMEIVMPGGMFDPSLNYTGSIAVFHALANGSFPIFGVDIPHVIMGETVSPYTRFRRVGEQRIHSRLHGPGGTPLGVEAIHVDKHDVIESVSITTVKDSSRTHGLRVENREDPVIVHFMRDTVADTQLDAVQTIPGERTYVELQGHDPYFANTQLSYVVGDGTWVIKDARYYPRGMTYGVQQVIRVPYQVSLQFVRSFWTDFETLVSHNIFHVENYVRNVQRYGLVFDSAESGDVDPTM